MNEFDVTEVWVDRIVVLAPAGELDLATAPGLSDAIRAAAYRQPAAMVVDLTKVTFLASAGMNALVSAHRLVARSGSGRFGVVANETATVRPLVLSGVDRMVTVFGLLDEALAAFADA